MLPKVTDILYKDHITIEYFRRTTQEVIRKYDEILTTLIKDGLATSEDLPAQQRQFYRMQ